MAETIQQEALQPPITPGVSPSRKSGHFYFALTSGISQGPFGETLLREFAAWWGRGGGFAGSADAVRGHLPRPRVARGTGGIHRLLRGRPAGARAGRAEGPAGRNADLPGPGGGEMPVGLAPHQAGLKNVWNLVIGFDRSSTEPLAAPKPRPRPEKKLDTGGGGIDDCLYGRRPSFRIAGQEPRHYRFRTSLKDTGPSPPKSERNSEPGR